MFQHVGISTSSLSSTHSCRSIIKNHAAVSIDETTHPARLPDRRVRFFSDHTMEHYGSYSLEFSDNSDSLADNVTVEVLEYDPCIDATNAPDLFFTCNEIDHMRTDARRQANRFAADYPDYVETLENLYDHGVVTTTTTTTDLAAVRKPLRHRRKRKHVMAIALKWSILDNDGDNDGDDDNNEEDYCFDEDVNEAAPAPAAVDYYANTEESHEPNNEVFCHVDMRGLEIRTTPMFRIHRKRAIDAVLHLQREMKKAGCCPAQIEIGLRAKAIQFSNRTKQFAIHQAQLDNMELLVM
jgi:hypothetical protein